MKEVKKSFWDFIFVSGSAILSIPIMIISEAVQARYLGPEKYGKVALIIGAISLLHLFGMSWLHRILMRFGKEEFLKEGHLHKTTGNYLALAFLCFISVAFIFFTVKSPILAFLEIKTAYAFWVILAGLLLMAAKEFILETLKVVRLIKLQQLLFRLVSKLAIVSGILFVAFILMDVRVEYIIAVFLGSDLLVILIGFIFINKRYFFPIRFDKKLLRTMFLFALPLLFTSWSGYVINWVDIYVIKYFMSMADVGVYQAAYKILSTLKSLLGASLVTLLTPIIMLHKTNNDFDKITNIYLKRLLPQISFISMLIISSILLVSDSMFDLIYGEAFNQSVVPFKILITSVSFSIITYALMPVITSFDLTRFMLYVGVSIGVLNLVADIILVPLLGIHGAALASGVVFMAGPMTWFFIIYKKFNVTRYLTLLFPFASVLILLANLSPSYSVRLPLTLGILVVAFWSGRQKNLFSLQDQSMLNNINMPGFIRGFAQRFITLASKS